MKSFVGVINSEYRYVFRVSRQDLRDLPQDDFRDLLLKLLEHRGFAPGVLGAMGEGLGCLGEDRGAPLGSRLEGLES